MALFFVTIFGLFVASVISFAEVGLRASESYDEQGRSAYATDGAVNAAINRFRGGGACNDYRAPSGPDGLPLYGQGVIVRCVDDDRPASGRATKPVNALLALGTAGAEGVSTYPGFEQRVLGNIFSNSTVAAGATLVVQGQVSATGDCTGDIQTSPAVPLRCANAAGGADPSQGRDPDYAKARSTVPARRTVPACPAGWLVTLDPGYYDDAAALSAFTTIAGSCPGKVVWMKPGDYYLDFTFRGGAGTWTFDNPATDVVAGTPKGWDPAAPARPAITVPGSCRTAGDAVPNDGVQVVAGGGTRVQITKGRVELCAKPSSTEQSIALYGMPGDRPVHNLVPTDWTGVSRFENPANATTVGEGPAPLTSDAGLAAGPSSSAAVTLTAFRPRIPDGALIDAAALRVVHQDIGSGADLDATSIKVAVPNSTCAGAQAVALPVRPTLMEDRVDLKVTCGVTTPAALNNLAAAYAATLAPGGTSATDKLDGIAIEVTYRTPVTGKPTVVTASAGFGTTANALEIGDQPVALTADASLSVGSPTASITVAGLGDPPIPPGSTIDAAVLRVAHRDEGQMTQPTVGVAIGGVAVGGCSSLLVPQRFGTSVVDDRIDLKACGLDLPAELAGLTATYTVALDGAGPTATARLDGMWLELVYRPPALTRSALAVTSGPTPGSFTTPDQAKVVGEQPVALTSDATLTTAAPTASLTFTGYDQPPAVPAGSFVDSAMLRVAHQDLGPMDTPTLTVTYPGGSCAPPLTKRAAALGTDPIDLTAAPCSLIDITKLTGIGVTYTANLTAATVTPPDATARVDGVVLDLAYRPPSVRRPTTAGTTTPGFADPDNAKAIGEQPAPLTADITLANPAAPADLTVSGFNAVPLPAGSAIDSAVLRVAHQDDPWMGAPSLTTTFTGSTCPIQTLPRHPAAIGTDRSVDLRTCGLDDPAKLATLAATFTAVAPTSTSTTQLPASTSAVTGFANPDNARAVGELPAPLTSDAALTGTTPATITLNGYNQAAPPGASPISAAVLRVAHQDDAGVAPVAVTVSLAGTPCVTQTFAPRATLGTDTVDLRTACGLTTAAQLADLAVTYEATLDGVATAGTARLDGAVLDVTYQATSGTDRLDGIELDIVYRPPTFRPLDGCLTTAPYPGTVGACALVSVQPAPGDTTTRFVAQGTVYAPTAALDISMDGLDGQVLTRGLVARAIKLGLRAAARFTRPVMGVPPEPVRLTAYPDVTARAVTPTTAGFTSESNALAIDGALAQAALSGPGASASITLENFAQSTLPAGAPIDAAVLRIAHREDVDIDAMTITVGGLPACTQPFRLSRSGLLIEDQVDLTPCGLDSLAKIGPSGLTVTYTVTLAGPPATGATADLDGITLDLLSGPLLRARVAFDATQDTVQVQGWSVLR